MVRRMVMGTASTSVNFIAFSKKLIGDKAHGALYSSRRLDSGASSEV